LNKVIGEGTGQFGYRRGGTMNRQRLKACKELIKEWFAKCMVAIHRCAGIVTRFVQKWFSKETFSRLLGSLKKCTFWVREFLVKIYRFIRKADQKLIKGLMNACSSIVAFYKVFVQKMNAWFKYIWAMITWSVASIVHGLRSSLFQISKFITPIKIVGHKAIRGLVNAWQMTAAWFKYIFQKIGRGFKGGWSVIVRTAVFIMSGLKSCCSVSAAFVHKNVLLKQNTTALYLAIATILFLAIGSYLYFGKIDYLPLLRSSQTIQKTMQSNPAQDEETNKLKEAVNTVQEKLTSTVNATDSKLQELANKVHFQVQTIEEAQKDIDNELQDTIEQSELKTTANLDLLEEAVQNQFTQVDQRIDHVQEDLAQKINTVEVAQKDLDSELKGTIQQSERKTMTNLGKLKKTVANQLTHVDQRIDHVQEDLAQKVNTLGTAQKDIGNELKDTLQKMEINSTDRLANLEQNMEKRLDKVAHKMQKVENKLVGHIQELKTSQQKKKSMALDQNVKLSKNISGVMQEVTGKIDSMQKQLEEYMTTTQTRLIELEKSMEHNVQSLENKVISNVAALEEKVAAQINNKITVIAAQQKEPGQEKVAVDNKVKETVSEYFGALNHDLKEYKKEQKRKKLMKKFFDTLVNDEAEDES